MAKKEKEVKTNAMRILEREKIPFEHFSYEPEGEFVDGIETADHLGLPHDEVYKTLVAVGSDRNHYVFVLPIEKELDLKKCAKSVGVKSVELIHVKELFALTGYARRLHFHRYEEAVLDKGRHLCEESRSDLCQRGENRRSDTARSG